MTDAELIATAALANIEAVLMAGDNTERAMQGFTPLWRGGYGMLQYGTMLADELYRRRKAAREAGKESL